MITQLLERWQPKKKELSFTAAALPIIAMMGLIGLGYILLDLRAEPILLVCTAFASSIAYYHGYSWQDVFASIINKFTMVMPAVLILIAVGLLIGAWMVGGTIPMMVFYGLKYIDASYFYVAALLLTAVVSLCTGTSWGSAGTIGVALMGVAVGLDVSLPIAAGAVISGAYFGDKLSPLSDTTNMAAISAGTPLYTHVGHLLWTTGLSFIICIIAYTYLGLSQGLEHIATPERIVQMLDSLAEAYHFNFLVILPPFIVLLGLCFRFSAIPVMFTASAIAFFNAIVFQDYSLKDVCDAIVSGPKLSMLHNNNLLEHMPIEISTLLERGGMMSMMNTLIICFCAFAFAGALSTTRSLEIVIARVFVKVKTVFGLIASTVCSTILICCVTSSGQLSALLPGEMFREKYQKMGLAPQNLSRTAEDSGVVIEPLLPWAASGIYMSSMLGVATVDYIPWAFLNYLGIGLSLFWAITGISITRVSKSTSP